MKTILKIKALGIFFQCKERWIGTGKYYLLILATGKYLQRKLLQLHLAVELLATGWCGYQEFTWAQKPAGQIHGRRNYQRLLYHYTRKHKKVTFVQNLRQQHRTVHRREYCITALWSFSMHQLHSISMHLEAVFWHRWIRGLTQDAHNYDFGLPFTMIGSYWILLCMQYLRLISKFRVPLKKEVKKGVCDAIHLQMCRTVISLKDLC